MPMLSRPLVIKSKYVLIHHAKMGTYLVCRSVDAHIGLLVDVRETEEKRRIHQELLFPLQSKRGA